MGYSPQVTKTWALLKRLSTDTCINRDSIQYGIDNTCYVFLSGICRGVSSKVDWFSWLCSMDVCGYYVQYEKDAMK